MRLCLERVLPRCPERPVTFPLPSLAAIANGEIDEPPPQNMSRATNAVTTALACGEITPGEAAKIARVYETFCANGRHCHGEGRPGQPAAEASDDCDPWRRCRRDKSSKDPYSTWRKNPSVDFLQMQEAESRGATRS
jgi:hypothetical protein